MTPFSGSYNINDVQILLKPVVMQDTPVDQKEALIQSGQKHYSQMLTLEALPPDAYLRLFYKAMEKNQGCVAQHLLILAERMVAEQGDEITLVSLARAGTPFGVLLKHILKNYYAVEASHYCVSIIRDVGLDHNALRYILKKHKPESLVFVDGWTGKGTIARTLTDSLLSFALSDKIHVLPQLYVLTDLSGTAVVAASSEDYLIPSSMLNSTVSGLISRTVYDTQSVQSGDFHACHFYRQFAPHDLSNYFVDEILSSVDNLWQKLDGKRPSLPVIKRARLQSISESFLNRMAHDYEVSHPNFIKLGIGESTRVLLRRSARLLLLRDLDCADTYHLHRMATAKSVPVEEDVNLPYRAVALIKEVQ